jgi:hypothetical protein
MIPSILSLVTFGTLARSLTINAPRATSVAEGNLLDPQGWTPRPTDGPKFPHELLRRQNVDTVLVAPDETCGFISGLAGAGYGCSATDTCVMFPATAGGWGAAGCCNENYCGIRDTCVDYVDYWSSSLCDNGCEKDTMTVKCTSAFYPYCNSIRWPTPGVEDFFCDSTYVGSWQIAYTTYFGEDDGRSFSVLALTDTSSNDVTFTSAAATSIQSAANTVARSSGATPVPVPTSTPSSQKSSAPIGAIIGGVIGGIAVIALIAVGLFLLFRKSNQNNPAQTAYHPTTHTGAPELSGQGFAGAAKPPVQTHQQEYYAPMSQNPKPPPQQQYQPSPIQSPQQYQPPSTESPQQYQPPPAGGFYSANDQKLRPQPDRASTSSPISAINAPAFGSEPPHSPAPAYVTYQAPNVAEVSGNSMNQLPNVEYSDGSQGVHEVYGSDVHR